MTRKTCKQCRKQFEASKPGQRPQKRFCSDACRLKAHRAKKRKKAGAKSNG